jgi:tetratricopeptide (TPR) repeat protein
VIDLRARRGSLFGALALVAGVLLWTGCARQATETELESDLFVAHGVELPQGQTPESVIRVLFDRHDGAQSAATVTIDYPLEGSLFPPELVAPTFLWHDPVDEVGLWLIDVAFDSTPHHIYALSRGPRAEPDIDWRAVTEENNWEEPEYQASAKAWTPDAALWQTMKDHSVGRDATVSVLGIAGPAGDPGAWRVVSRGSVTIRTSSDPVGAMVFYRDVPLMPTETREGIIQPLDESMFPLVQWRLRDLSRPEAPVVMTHLPTCANCHSFSADGATLGMDMDGPGGDKGAYVLADISPDMIIENEDVFTWNDFPGKLKDINTFGMFSRVSPDGRYVVTTVNEDLFVTNFTDIMFMQTFYPTRGILVVYDRRTGEIAALPGADDPKYVHANPEWSPDQKTLVFLRAEAKDPYDGGPLPEHANHPRETQIQYDLYRIPFNGGRGGTAEPVRGASANGMSNSYPRFSPDGKWIVFVQAKNALLLRPDSRLYIIPAEGGEARLMGCNTDRMNSYHSWSPNSRWLAFSSKVNRPFTQLFLTHVDENGNDTPPVLVPNSTADNRAVNLPELVKLSPGDLERITTPAVDYRRHLDTARELDEQGRTEEALAEFEKSLELKPDYWETHLTLANVLIREGQAEESIEHYRQAVELNPRFYWAHNNLGVALRQTGAHEEAIEQLRIALEINPGSAPTHSSLGLTLAMTGDLAAAARHFETALRIDPALEHAHYGYGRLLLQADRVDDAVAHLEQALKLEPDDHLAHQYLALALTRQRRYVESAEHYAAAIRIAPGYHPAYDRLARLKAAHGDPRIRDGEEAVRLAEAACQMTNRQRASYLHTLAMAYAAAGRFEEAAITAEHALVLALDNENRTLATQIATHHELFREGKALRLGN